MDAGLIARAVIIAELVVRTALAELRMPGAARAEWPVALDPGALAAAAAVLTVVSAVGASRPAVAWGLIAAALTGLSSISRPGAAGDLRRAVTHRWLRGDGFGPTAKAGRPWSLPALTCRASA
ncbi:hypothetical protein ACFVLG_19445 [Streptomyces rochei]|uniref:hypothetical protein n=1 Tax=Streptomyces rochei TaxID=1928 RepID=UPI003427FF95